MRRLVAGLIGVVLLTGSVLAAVATPAAAGSLPVGTVKTATTQLNELQSCLAEQDRAEVLLLVDESPSLRETDPGNARVTAAQALIGGLVDLSTNAHADINLRIAGFNTQLHSDPSEYGEWTKVERGSEAALDERVEAFRGRTGDGTSDTDYWTALNDARELLQQRDPSPTSCKMLFFFTDGDFFITYDGKDGATKRIPGAEDVRITDSASRDQVVAAGVADLCRAGGIADSLRNSNITTIGIGLGVPDAATGVAPDLALLDRIAADPSGDCGALPGNGALVRAGSPSELTWLMDSLVTPGASDTQDKSICVADDIASCDTRTFTLDGTLRSVSILASASVDGLNYLLTPPVGGEPLILSASASTDGAQKLGGVDVSYRWYADRQSVRITLEYPDNGEGWAGEWRLVSRDPAKADAGTWRSRIAFTGDLRPRFDDTGGLTGPGMVLGEDARVQMSLERNDGSIVPREQLQVGDAVPTVSVSYGLSSPGYPSGVPGPAVLGLDQIGSPATIFVPKDFPLGDATLSATLSVTTVGGLVLEPVTRTMAVRVVPPVYRGYVTTRGPLVFGRIDGTDPVRRSIDVRGPSCVWIEPTPTLQAFAEGVEARIGSAAESAESCVTVAEGATTSIPLTLQVSDYANAHLGGTLAVHLLAADAADEATQAIAFTAEQRRPIDALWYWTVLTLSILIALLAPLLVWFAIRWNLARVPRGIQAVDVLQLEAVLSPGGLRTAHGDGRSEVASAWEYRDDLGGAKSFELAGLVFRARSTLDPSQAGYLRTADPALVGVSGPVAVGGRGDAARLPLELMNNWLFVAPRNDVLAAEPTEVAGTILLIVRADLPREQRLELLEQARDRAWPLIAKLAASAVGTPRRPRVSAADPDWTADPTARPSSETEGDDGWGSGSASASASTSAGARSPATTPASQGADDGWAAPAAPGAAARSGDGWANAAPAATPGTTPDPDDGWATATSATTPAGTGSAGDGWADDGDAWNGASPTSAGPAKDDGENDGWGGSGR